MHILVFFSFFIIIYESLFYIFFYILSLGIGTSLKKSFTFSFSLVRSNPSENGGREIMRFERDS